MRALTSQKVTDAVNKARTGIDELAAKSFTNKEAAALVSLVYKAVKQNPKPLTDEQGNAAYGSVMHLLGTTPTKEVLVANLYRLAANWYLIEDGVIIPTWGGEPTPSDVAFLSVKKGPKQATDKRRKYEVKIRLKTGLCAGIISWVSLSDAFIYRFLDRIAGTRSFKCSAEEIAGMEGRAIVELRNGRYVLSELTATQRQKENNRRISEARSAVDKCRRGIPCNVCSATVKQCPLAVYESEVSTNGRKN